MNHSYVNGRNPIPRFTVCLIALALLAVSGCANSRWARLRRAPLNPLTNSLELDSWQGPQPTDRTLQMLRRNDLVTLLERQPKQLVTKVQEVAYEEPTADNVYSIAEVAYISAKRVEEQGESSRALDLYATAAANAYFYLFDSSFERGRNPYDPRFRRACDLYNNSLEAGLRSLQKQDKLKPGMVDTIVTDEQTFDIQIATRGTWHEDNFDKLKFVSDFKVEELKNVYRTFGLGVPLIAVYKEHHDHAADRFYPSGMSFPVTAFMRIVESTPDPGNPRHVRHRCVIELHDPMVGAEVQVQNTRVPLETDLTTPLAYSLDNPAFERANVPIRGLRQPEKSLTQSGLYMLEPYHPNKIPVVMVHGFWSSLVTWMEMFNDLRGSPEIRDNYQFWFYLYPTGTPFWFSAAHFRQQLTLARDTLDPQHRAPNLDQMVLVGHSMGGLISMLQTIDSEDEVWKLISDRPFDELQASTDDLANLRYAFYFKPNESVRRVVTIASPLRGSNFSNMATQWLGDRFINLPERLVETRKRLLRDNPGYFRSDSLINITTSVSSLAADSQLLRLMDATPTAPWVQTHNIIGVLGEKNSVLKAVAQESDGVVQVASAHSLRAASEIRVPSDHVNVHRHPRAILEVRRILLEHLQELRANQVQLQYEHELTTYTADEINDAPVRR